MLFCRAYVAANAYYIENIQMHIQQPNVSSGWFGCVRLFVFHRIMHQINTKSVLFPKIESFQVGFAGFGCCMKILWFHTFKMAMAYVACFRIFLLALSLTPPHFQLHLVWILVICLPAFTPNRASNARFSFVIFLCRQSYRETNKRTNERDTKLSKPTN